MRPLQKPGPVKSTKLIAGCLTKLRKTLWMQPWRSTIAWCFLTSLKSSWKDTRVHGKGSPFNSLRAWSKSPWNANPRIRWSGWCRAFMIPWCTFHQNLVWVPSLSGSWKAQGALLVKLPFSWQNRRSLCTSSRRMFPRFPVTSSRKWSALRCVHMCPSATCWEHQDMMHMLTNPGLEDFVRVKTLQWISSECGVQWCSWWIAQIHLEGVK